MTALAAPDLRQEVPPGMCIWKLQLGQKLQTTPEFKMDRVRKAVQEGGLKWLESWWTCQMKNEDKSKALEAAIGQDREGVRQGLGDEARAARIGRGYSGHLDRLARSGHWPWYRRAFRKGRIIEIYGPESSGKTTLALHAVAEAQKDGGNCAFVDAEHALDPAYARKLGVDIDELLISQPDAG